MREKLRRDWDLGLRDDEDLRWRADQAVDVVTEKEGLRVKRLDLRDDGGELGWG